MRSYTHDGRTHDTIVVEGGGKHQDSSDNKLLYGIIFFGILIVFLFVILIAWQRKHDSDYQRGYGDKNNSDFDKMLAMKMFDSDKGKGSNDLVMALLLGGHLGKCKE